CYAEAENVSGSCSTTGQFHQGLATPASAPRPTGLFLSEELPANGANVATVRGVQTRPSTRPQSGRCRVRQCNNRSPTSSCSSTHPHPKQVLPDGCQRSASTTWLPHQDTL